MNVRAFRFPDTPSIPNHNFQGSTTLIVYIPYLQENPRFWLKNYLSRQVRPKELDKILQK